MTLFVPVVRIAFLSCRCSPVLNCSFLRTSRSLCWLYASSRHFGSDKNNKKSLTKLTSKSEVGPATTFEQVKETTKTASYWGIILAGFGLTGVLFYAVFNELFSSKSPSSVYGAALQRCSHDPRVMDALGEPLKGFGEETRRGRRRHVSHLFYERDGINYLRMKFYIQGNRRKGTVHLEMRENEKKKFEYRYLFVQLEEYPRDVILLEDNRYDDPTPADGSKIFDTL